MKPWQMNPYIRYMDRRTCSVSYKAEIMAYDYRLFADINGCYQLEIDGQVLTLNKDSIVIFPPAMPYRFVFSEENPAELYDINFNLNFVCTAGISLHPDEIGSFDPVRMPENPDAELFAKPFLVEHIPELCQEVGALLRERETCGEYGDELCAAMLKGILIKVMRASERADKTEEGVIGEVKRYLEERCRESITREQLGRRFGYHPIYLNSLFKKQTGKSLHQFQMECRMKRACSMLTGTRLSIREIAESTGFSSPAYFSELFVKAVGLTPSQYRGTGK